MRKIKLDPPSSTLNRTMTIDTDHVSDSAKFWSIPSNSGSSENQIWQTCAKQYINKPYLDVMRPMRRFYDISDNGFTIHHRNHDVTHAVRQRHYAQQYLIIIQDTGNPEFKQAAQSINQNKEMKAALELAIYLCRSGRTNEKSGQEDPSNAKRSAALFSEVAKELEIDPGLINFLQFAVATHAPDLNKEKYQELINGIPGKPEEKHALAELMKGVIDLSHHTDLVRCKVGPPKQPVGDQIEKELSHFVDTKKANPKIISQNMLAHAAKACELTGTRIKYNTFKHQSPENNPRLKAKYTQNVDSCFEMLNSLELDVYKNPRIETILNQVEESSSLNLSNQELNEFELETVKTFISENSLTSVNLIGIKPDSARQQIESVCSLYIDIKTITVRQGDDISPINSQFRQAAINEQKVSMRFEPSRIGGAYLSGGITGLFKQLWREVKGDIPRYGGADNFTEISNIKKLQNSTIEDNYDDHKHPVASLPTQLIDSLHTLDMDDIHLQPGEMLLYHGVSQDIAPLIMNSGFDEERCKYVPGNGYGPLGKGVYFTNELSKAGTFASCPMCNQCGECGCVDPETGDQPDRVILVSKVFVGNPEIILRKGDIQERTEPSEGYDSCISLSKNIDPISGFRSTEICIPKGAQAVPLYAVNYKSQPSLLKKGMIERKFSECGLTKNKNVQTGVKSILEDSKHLIGSHQKNFRSFRTTSLQLMEKVDTLKNTLEEQKANTTTPKEITALKTQINTLSRLNKQLKTYSKEDIKPQIMQNPEKQKTGILLKIKSLFISKEQALKQKLLTDFKAVGNISKMKPSEFIDKQINLLNTAIERDCAKGTHIFMKKSYPQHRAVVTNAMVRLRSKLMHLQTLNLSEQDLARKSAEITGNIIGMAGVGGELLEEIKSSTNYKLLYNLNHMSSAILNSTAIVSQRDSVIPSSVSPTEASLTVRNTSTLSTKASISPREERSHSMSMASLSDISDEAWNQTKEQLRSEPSHETPIDITVAEPEVSNFSSSSMRSP